MPRTRSNPALIDRGAMSKNHKTERDGGERESERERERERERKRERERERETERQRQRQRLIFYTQG